MPTLSAAYFAAEYSVGIFLIVWSVLALAVFAFWLWMLIDVLTSSMPSGEKIVWALVIFFLPLIGSLIYFFVGRGSARRSL